MGLSQKYEFRTSGKADRLIETKIFPDPRSAAKYAEKLSRKHKIKILACTTWKLW